MKELWSNLCFYGRCVKVVCREWWRKVFPCAVLSCACGCVNLYTRCPTTAPQITRCYQSTGTAAALAIVCSFPQMMSDNPGDGGFMWENCFTIPFLGLPCAVDAACEAVVDTVCLPCDWWLSEARERKEKQ